MLFGDNYLYLFRCFHIQELELDLTQNGVNNKRNLLFQVPRNAQLGGSKDGSFSSSVMPSRTQLPLYLPLGPHGTVEVLSAYGFKMTIAVLSFTAQRTEEGEHDAF